MSTHIDDMIRARELFLASVKAYKVALDTKDPSRDWHWRNRLRYEAEYLERCRDVCEINYPTGG